MTRTGKVKVKVAVCGKKKEQKVNKGIIQYLQCHSLTKRVGLMFDRG